VLAPEVRVNAVAPGWIAGEWMQRTLGDNYDRLMERRATWTPMRRNVTGEDVAETIFSLITSNPFRHRRDDRHRRRLRGYQLTPAGPMSPVR